jgi:DNA-binding NtrC family response regulator
MLLCVDDDPLILGAVSRLFRRTVTARSIDEAVRIATSVRPRVILLDIILGEEWGLDAIPMLLQVSPESKIIVFTAKTTTDLRHESFAAGAFAFIDKMHLSRLREVVDDIVTAPIRQTGKRAALH